MTTTKIPSEVQNKQQQHNDNFFYHETVVVRPVKEGLHEFVFRFRFDPDPVLDRDLDGVVRPRGQPGDPVLVALARLGPGPIAGGEFALVRPVFQSESNFTIHYRTVCTSILQREHRILSV